MRTINKQCVFPIFYGNDGKLRFHLLWFCEIVMLVLFEGTLFYLMVVAVTKTTSVTQYREYYNPAAEHAKDSDRNRIHVPSYKESRHKRIPITPVLPQGVSHPIRFGEGSLDSPGDSDRFKEVVHIPCPKVKGSHNRKFVSFKQNHPQDIIRSRISRNNVALEKSNGDVLRLARELFPSRMYPASYSSSKVNSIPAQPVDLNHAVKQNQQSLISSSQGRAQSVDHNVKLPLAESNVFKNHPDQQSRLQGTNQPRPLLSQDYYYVGQAPPQPVLNSVNTPNKIIESNELASQKVKNNKFVDNRKIKVKSEGYLNNISAPSPNYSQQQYPQMQKQQMTPSSAMSFHNTWMFDLNPKMGPKGPKPNDEIAPPGILRYQTNTYNLTYESPNACAQPQSQTNEFNYVQAPKTPSMQYVQIANASEVKPGMLNQQALPVWSQDNYTRGIHYSNQGNANLPPQPANTPMNQRYFTQGELGTAISPRMPVKEACKQQNINGIDRQSAVTIIETQQQAPNLPNKDAIKASADYLEPQNVSPAVITWKNFNGVAQNNVYQVNTPLVSVQQHDNKYYWNDKPPNTQVGVEKPLSGLGEIKWKQRIKEKLKKDDIKGRHMGSAGEPKFLKGTQIEYPRVFGVNIIALDNPAIMADKGYTTLRTFKTWSNQPGGSVVMEQPNQIEEGRNHMASAPKPQHSQTGSLDYLDHKQHMDNRNVMAENQNYNAQKLIPQKKFLNASRALTHVLAPPVSVEPNLFTNKGVRVVSKVPSYGELTYRPFMGFRPARNDEAFYDKKNMDFLGRIDHPPLANLKRSKDNKVAKHYNGKVFHNRFSGEHLEKITPEQADIYGDIIARSLRSPNEIPLVSRLARKCHQAGNPFWRHGKSQERKGLHRAKVSPLSLKQ